MVYAGNYVKNISSFSVGSTFGIVILAFEYLRGRGARPGRASCPSNPPDALADSLYEGVVVECTCTVLVIVLLSLTFVHHFERSAIVSDLLVTP